VYTTQHWANEHYLEINSAKTEYVIFGNAPRNDIRVADSTVQSNSTTTYLGFSRNNSSAVPHVRKRIAKAKSASFAFANIIRRFPHLPTRVKASIADACVRSTALYGMEALQQADLNTRKMKKKINIVLRR
jgi:hypothetical protein